MKKTSILFLGIGLFLGGTMIQIDQRFFQEDITSTGVVTNQAYEQSQKELSSVKEQLAQLQLNLENAQKEQPNEPHKEENKQQASSPPVQGFTLSITSGMTSSDISSLLEEAGIIQNQMDLHDYIVDQNLAGRIQIGNYEVNSSMTIKQITELITN
ncbi:hypothetical protein [uncultured Psychrobacillus sp.]|uniref:hypothetical protein n=1 Tax=uncultured Psychrobacillus sp. TaxID=1551585 RepID=UPI0026148D68|nr:hypothetical protein [uncultured Psychrobacillus sp.]